METLRYFYHPDLSIWLSVDPLSDKHPNLTPYAYCANNPVIFGDPDGSSFTNFEDTEGNLVKHIEDGSNAVYRQTGSGTGRHYAFTRYDESQGGENIVNLQTAIQEQHNNKKGGFNMRIINLFLFTTDRLNFSKK